MAPSSKALILLTSLCGIKVACAAPSPLVRAWGANSFRVQWAAPSYNVTESEYSPFLDAPLSGRLSTINSDGSTFTNGNMAVTVSADGLIRAARVSDGAIVFELTALTFSEGVSASSAPSAQLTYTGFAQGETLVGGGEQGLTGRVTLEQPFQRVFVDTEYYGASLGTSVACARGEMVNAGRLTPPFSPPCPYSALPQATTMAARPSCRSTLAVQGTA